MIKTECPACQGWRGRKFEVRPPQPGQASLKVTKTCSACQK